MTFLPVLAPNLKHGVAQAQESPIQNMEIFIAFRQFHKTPNLFVLALYMRAGFKQKVMNSQLFTKIMLGNLFFVNSIFKLLGVNEHSKQSLMSMAPLNHLKAHLVAKGYYQVDGIDYYDTNLGMFVCLKI